MTRLLALAPLLILFGCATLSEDECRGADWYEIGRSDGADGRRANFLQQHAKACRDYGIRPDVVAWRKGRADGLPLYCTPSRAYREGTRGKHLSPVCPAEGLERLERANARGLRYYRVGQEISQIEREIRDINAQLASLPADDPSRASLASERSFLRLDLLSLRAERARYRNY